jgi:hypothetical protein
VGGVRRPGTDLQPASDRAYDSDHDDAQPSDPDVKQELKPKACALGGELITLMSSNEKHNRYGGKLSGRFLAFQVLAKKAAGGPQQS